MQCGSAYYTPACRVDRRAPFGAILHLPGDFSLCTAGRREIYRRRPRNRWSSPPSRMAWPAFTDRPCGLPTAGGQVSPGTRKLYPGPCGQRDWGWAATVPLSADQAAELLLYAAQLTISPFHVKRRTCATSPYISGSGPLICQVRAVETTSKTTGTAPAEPPTVSAVPENVPRRPFGATANTAAAPCGQQEATDLESKNRRPEEVTIPTDNEPTGSHCQSNPDQHLDGPPLGEKPQERRLSPARMRARRLLDTASDELVRLAVQASATGVYVWAVHWIERR
jgi:hypothetical protein